MEVVQNHIIRHCGDSALILLSGEGVYRFSGKERLDRAGLPLYDFGARWYNPATPAWTTPAPLAEKYYDFSPYAYCAGDPVLIFDMEGKELVIYYQDDKGRQYAHHFTGETDSHPNPFVNNVIQAYLNSKTVWKKAGFNGHSPLVTLVESNYQVSVKNAGIGGNTLIRIIIRYIGIQREV